MENWQRVERIRLHLPYLLTHGAWTSGLWAASLPCATIEMLSVSSPVLADGVLVWRFSALDQHIGDFLARTNDPVQDALCAISFDQGPEFARMQNALQKLATSQDLYGTLHWFVDIPYILIEFPHHGVRIGLHPHQHALCRQILQQSSKPIVPGSRYELQEKLELEMPSSAHERLDLALKDGLPGFF